MPDCYSVRLKSVDDAKGFSSLPVVLGDSGPALGSGQLSHHMCLGSCLLMKLSTSLLMPLPLSLGQETGAMSYIRCHPSPNVTPRRHFIRYQFHRAPPANAVDHTR